VTKYRWSSPYAWLEWKSAQWSKEELRRELLGLAIKHDSDTLQDDYEAEMNKDGYFTEIKTKEATR